MEFYKLSGCGNDFIAVDNRNQKLTQERKSNLAASLCRRRISMGADGMLFIENSHSGHAYMDYYNADGSQGEMCGNGLRSFALLTAHMDICPKEMTVETPAGIYTAKVLEQNLVRIDMPPVGLPHFNVQLSTDLPLVHALTVGVPHVVVFAPDIWDWPGEKIESLGRTIRNSTWFPNGTNVNFVTIGEHLKVRTYERGVEAETLACGTGATASALITALHHNLTGPITVEMPGGVLTVGFEKSPQGFLEVWLQGAAKIIAKGEFYPESI